jgi:DNA-binding NtrC family response regulator
MPDPNHNLRKILLVDDEPQITHMIGSLLGRMGPNYRMLLALDKNKVLELLKQENPEVLLLDIDLYGISSGLEILDIVNREHKNTKPIVITGRAKSHRAQIEKIGCFHFFEKPFDVTELNEKIKEALGLDKTSWQKEISILRQNPNAKLLFIEPDLRYYAYLCSIFDSKEMLNGADYTVKILGNMGDLLTVLATYLAGWRLNRRLLP